MEKENYTVDFKNVKDSYDMHRIFKESMDFPYYYGHNLDALWDMLTGFIETPIEITVIYKPENKMAENLKESVLKVIETFKEASEEDEEIKINIKL